MSEYGNFVGITFENVGKTIGILWGIEMELRWNWGGGCIFLHTSFYK